MEKIKVLMVDDEEQFRTTTSKILTRKGFETRVAASGEEAVGIIQKERHDVVVLDVRMPGMDGHDALARIKKLDPSIQVIMLTGHAEPHSARRSLDYEAFDYLSKPCDIERLSARIQDAWQVTHKGQRTEKKTKDIMIPLEDYTVISPDKSVREGIEALQASFEGLISTDKIMQTGHRSILVMDKKGELTGVLSIMDLIRSLRPAYLSAPKPSMADNVEFSAMFWTGLFTAQAKSLAGKNVSEVMSPPPPSVDENANLMEAANLLFEKECRRLVVKRGDKVIGVVREQEIFFEAAGTILRN